MKLLAAVQNPILTKGLESVMEADGSWQVVAFSGPTADILDVTRDEKPDVLLMDFDPAEHFGDVLDLCDKLPESPIVLLIRDISPEMAYQALNAGVRGILRASVADVQLLDCLECVRRGERWCDDDLKAAFFNARTAVLSPRESQLVVLISQGLKNKEIASTLAISESTVRIYLSNIFQRLGMKDRYELAIYGFRTFMQHPRVSAAGLDPASLSADGSGTIRFVILEKPRPRRRSPVASLNRLNRLVATAAM